MTITQTAPTGTAAAVTITGTVRSPLMLVRSITDRVARVSFRVEGEDGRYNVHATGPRAELYRSMIAKGSIVTIHAESEIFSRPNQTIPDLEIDSLELHIL